MKTSLLAIAILFLSCTENNNIQHVSANDTPLNQIISPNEKDELMGTLFLANDSIAFYFSPKQKLVIAKRALGQDTLGRFCDETMTAPDVESIQGCDNRVFAIVSDTGVFDTSYYAVHLFRLQENGRITPACKNQIKIGMWPSDDRVSGDTRGYSMTTKCINTDRTLQINSEVTVKLKIRKERISLVWDESKGLYERVGKGH